MSYTSADRVTGQGGNFGKAAWAENDKLLPIVVRMQRTVASMTAMVGKCCFLRVKPEQLEFRRSRSVLARAGGGGDRRNAARGPVTFSSRARPADGFGKPWVSRHGLHNLLDNACRYTEQGRILLEFRAVNASDGYRSRHRS